MIAKAFSVILCTVVMVILPTTLVNSEYESRIVGGVSVDISNRPFQVVVLTPGLSLCGGSLITLNAVLTAAHCVENILPSNIKVRAGTNVYDSGIDKSVSKNVVHAAYNPLTMNMDIAILKTIIPFVESNNIKTIPLATVLPPTGSLVVVSGYGTLRSGGSLANNLQQVTVEMIDFKSCNNQYSNQLKSSMFCAADFGKDSCQGDSGGPVTYNGNLIGVVSWGAECADSNYPGVYTKVPMFKRWIQNTIDFINK